MITIVQKGDWKVTTSFLERALELVKLGTLDKYGQEGVEALQNATPKDTGKTASSWYYQIVRTDHSVSLQWCNSNSNDGVLIAILIQYGHAFQNGEFLEGIDFINPALKPIFKEISEKIRKELSRK